MQQVQVDVFTAYRTTNGLKAPPGEACTRVKYRPCIRRCGGGGRGVSYTCEPLPLYMAIKVHGGQSNNDWGRGDLIHMTLVVICPRVRKTS